MKTFKDIKIKVLPLPNFFDFYKRIVDADATLTECVENYAGYAHEIVPIIGKHGWYYDRVNNFSWFELENRAFVYLSPESFVYELKMLSHNPLPAKAKQAIIVLIHYNVCPNNLKELIYIDNCLLMSQQAYKSASKFRLRMKKRKQELTNTP